jgi:hypothetical protein
LLDNKVDSAAARMLLARGVGVEEAAACLGRSVTFVKQVGGERVKGKGKGNVA